LIPCRKLFTIWWKEHLYTLPHPAWSSLSKLTRHRRWSFQSHEVVRFSIHLRSMHNIRINSRGKVWCLFVQGYDVVCLNQKILVDHEDFSHFRADIDMRLHWFGKVRWRLVFLAFDSFADWERNRFCVNWSPVLRTALCTHLDYKNGELRLSVALHFISTYSQSPL